MMRGRLTVAAGLVVAVGVPMPVAAGVEGPQCRGEEATHVVTEGETVQGTEGDDVVVIAGGGEGETRVDTLGGNDLVCVVGTDFVTVFLGEGADRFYHDEKCITHADYCGPTVDGGPGDDELSSGQWWDATGGPGNDRISGLGDSNGYVRGGDGDDWLYVKRSGGWHAWQYMSALGGRGRDVMYVGLTDGVHDGGPGRDLLVALPNPLDFFASHMTGGPGRDTLRTPRDTGRWAFLDSGADGGDTYGARGNTSTLINYLEASGPMRVDLALGTARNLAEDAAAGTDRLLGVNNVGGTSRWSDVIIGNAHNNYLQALVADPELRQIGGPGAISTTPSDRFVGRAGNDEIWAPGIGSLIRGGRGADVLDLDRGGGDPPDEFNSSAFGGPGNDTLTGSRFDDLLVGRGGDDSADGLEGTDTCYAETVVNCELGSGS